jgi:transcriptional regulator with XRE-family HTH domain
MEDLEKIRKTVSRMVRELRARRKMTQVDLAKLLRLSQSRLSEIERGDGSFTAEQLLLLLKIFNVTVRHFSPPGHSGGAGSSSHAQLQRALARLAATHLREDADVLPTERLAAVSDVVQETLLDGTPRHLTALAPVLVNNIRHLSLRRLWADLARLGLEHRLAWVVENTLEAVRLELQGRPPRSRMLRYKRAEVTFDMFVSFARAASPAERDNPPDLLDETAFSAETCRELEEASTEISRRWKIITDLKPEDFAHALRAAGG